MSVPVTNQTAAGWGEVRRDDPVLLARMIWALVHGIAMLAIDGQLRDHDADVEALNRYAILRLRDAIRAD